jgi:hypothetical protein
MITDNLPHAYWFHVIWYVPLSEAVSSH